MKNAAHPGLVGDPTWGAVDSWHAAVGKEIDSTVQVVGQVDEQQTRVCGHGHRLLVLDSDLQVVQTVWLKKMLNKEMG